MADLHLPGMNARIVQHPHHARPLRSGKRLHLLHGGGRAAGRPLEGPWEWAVLLRAVSGWKVIAHGADFTTPEPATHKQVSDLIARNCRGADGSGFDRLPRSRYSQTGTTLHIRRDDPCRTYCGASAGQDAVFDTSQPRHAEQHCITCDAAYRAQNWGRCPVTY